MTRIDRLIRFIVKCIEFWNCFYSSYFVSISKCCYMQSMPGDTCDRTCAYPHPCKIPRTREKSPVPTSLLTVQSHMPNRNHVVATATPVTITSCFHNSALSCFILNEIFDMLQQQETLFCGYTNHGSHVQIQISKSNHSCKRGCTCELTLLHQFLPGMDCLCEIINL